MANNRMYLVNRETGARILLSKYYPSTGWFVAHNDLANKLNVALHEHDFGDVPAGLYSSSGGSVGDTDWHVEYETTNPLQ